MAPITIGVPVYNGADLLDESLACLARQTFGDFKVLIFDNASTDATAEIAEGWAARDARFHYVRQPRNVGGVANFRDALLAAESPWFLWRADDDLSADDYVETLYRLTTESPGCKLAASTILSHDLDGGRRRLTPPPEIRDPATVSGRVRMLLGCHPSWLYGLWDRETIVNAYLAVCANFPFAFASDHLLLYGPIIDGVVRTTTKTQFIQRTRRTAATPRRQTRMPFALMRETRRAFRAELRRMRSERQLSAPLRAALLVSEPFYLQHTLPSLLKMARTAMRELLGIAGPRGAGRHFERNS
ncbi:MAG: glycosyltransferase family 2 protein [Roseiarcus sp.]|jgi:glycosyltransferase involved in cell wall biosynthesis